MRLLFVIAVVIWCIVGDGSAQNRRPSSNEGYVLVFSDEFNQPDGSRPDPTKWVACKRYNAGWNRWISAREDVAYISKGRLVCKAIPNRSLSTDTAKMLTGAIETRGKFSFKYGKVEVRMKTSKRIGNTPAVWMKPEVQNPDRYGEIDIVETFGNLGVAQQTVHGHQTVVLKKKGKKNAFRTDVNVSKWHVYGMEWDSEAIIFTIDGVVTARYERSHNARDIKEGQWTFDRPFFLLMNQSVGDGRFECTVPDTKHTYVTYFDWIRVYQKIKK